jgi:alpha-L-fucosidase
MARNEEKKVGWLGRMWAVLVFCLCLPAHGEAKMPLDADHDRRMEWFRESRFGMFIHFGLYSVGAGEWDGKPVGFGEYFGFRNPADWQTLLPKFNPEKFDADAVARAAKDAGMKYLVITSKHHDGFCLFDSKHTDFDVMSTPFKRDIIGELSAACRKHGLKFGFYYSIIDLHHPDYLPRPAFDPRPEEGRDFERYVGFMKDQLKELLTNYGEIDVVWFDGEWESSWTHERAKDMWDYIRGIDPDVLINNRIDKGRAGMQGINTAPHFLGDFGTPEQELVERNPGEDWETCQTMNRKGNWGWRKDEADFFSPTELIRQVIACSSMGGNMLLNVGPKDDGTIPQTSAERLDAIGKWMAAHGESIHGSQASPYEKPPAWGTVTVKGEVMYCHVFERPADGVLIVPSPPGAPVEAWALNDPAKASLNIGKLDDGSVTISISEVPVDPHATVIAIRFQQEKAPALPDQSGAASEGDFPLVRDGAPACMIVTAVSPTPSARLAALELQSHILKMTGVEMPIRHEAEETEGARILVGDTAATRELGVSPEDFGQQEYLVAFHGNDLVLTGRDWLDTPENRSAPGGQALAEHRPRIDYWQAVGLPNRGALEIELPGIYDEQGTSHAVYHFLERHCGVRWYGPTELTSVIPKHPDLLVKREDVRRSPVLKLRSAMYTAMWPMLRGQWGEFSQPQLFLHWRRLRQGGEPWMANHTITHRSIAAAMNNPAIQAQGEAVKGWNLCYTNPATVELIAGMARNFFDGKGPLPPEAKAMGDYFAVVPEDTSHFCECPECKKLLEMGSAAGAGLFSSAGASEYWFSFVNAIARELRKTHPDKWITTLAYWNYCYPPHSFAIEPNVAVAPCLHVCEYPMNPAVRDNDRAIYQGWRAASEAPMFLWNYYHLPTERALIQGWKCFPHIMLRQTAGAAKRFARDGVRGIFVCGEQDQLEHYVMVRLWDDPTLDTEVLADEFFTLYFGAAAEPMKRFYQTIESIACDPENYPSGVPMPMQDADIAWSKLGTPERMKQLGALIQAAEASATGEAEKQRVDMWRGAIWQWMLDGRSAYDAKPK